jgi:hypothetical protein
LEGTSPSTAWLEVFEMTKGAMQAYGKALPGNTGWKERATNYVSSCRGIGI